MRARTALLAGLLALGNAAPALAQDLTGTLQKIKETGVIVLGHRELSVPFSYLDDSQNPVGYAMDICMSVVEAVKQKLVMPELEIELTPVSSSTRIPLMANGTVDLECGSTTNNAERQQQVAFTNTHFLTASRFVSKVASDLKTIDDLAGKTVVSTSGTTNMKQLNQANNDRSLGINIVPAKDHAEAFLMVETDRAVAFVMDDILLASLIAGSKNPSTYIISDDAFSLPEPYAIMLRKDDPAFKAVVDDATAAFFKGPQGEATYEKWFLQPIPPKNLNLNVPMSAGLRKAYETPMDTADPKAYAG